MFLGSNRPGGSGGNDVHISTRTDPNNDFGWTTPVNLGAVVNSAFSELTGTYFEDPATGAGSLIFSSDRIAMNGMTFRFYQSTRNADGTFNAPVLIDELNGEGSHFGAAIRRDGLEIFFGSVRPGGLNIPAFDIWVSTRASTSAHWNPPVLAAGVNSLEEDRLPKLSPDGSILYFQSDRAGGFGNSPTFDLYSATRCSLYVVLPCNVNFGDDRQIDGISIFRPSMDDWRILKNSKGHNPAIRIEH